MNQLTTGTDEMYKHKNTELNNLRTKLDIVHHLALTKANDNHFDKLNDPNDFKDKLIQSLGNKPINGNLGLPVR